MQAQDQIFWLDHGVASNKLLEMKYKMDDRKFVMEEAQANFAEVEHALLKAEH